MTFDIKTLEALRDANKQAWITDHDKELVPVSELIDFTISLLNRLNENTI